MADLSQGSLPEPRRDTPTPGWESGVWVRIQRQRRKHRLALGILVVALASAATWAVLARRRHPEEPALASRVQVQLETAARSDGSAPLHASWRVAYEGAELRVYRNALGMVRRCPEGPGCVSTPGGGVLTLPLDEAGEYRALVFSRPVSGGGQTLQEDLAASRTRGEAVEMSASLVVY
ncbi:MAG TPA: hypothetical protein VGG91_23540 [Myxococcaceae bacterium]